MTGHHPFVFLSVVFLILFPLPSNLAAATADDAEIRKILSELVATRIAAPL